MKKRKKLLLTIAAAVSLSLIVAVVVIYRYYFGARYEGAETAWVYVKKDMTPAELRDELSNKLGDAGQRVYRIWQMLGGDIKNAHGAYCIHSGDNVPGIAFRLQKGRQSPVSLTFNNIRTLNQLASRVSNKLEIDSATFIATCDSVLHAYTFEPATYTAAFLPDTYEFYWNSSPVTVVERLADTRSAFWTEERMAKADALGLTPMQVTIVASIAEEETNSRSERGVVGRLYINRLKKGMRLQADPTVKFAVGDFALRRITGEQLSIDSPYNTYRYAGLPPGPIRMPEAATIDSILNSAPHNYIYMCAKEDFSGLHNFSTTFDAHRANAINYHKALNRRNIK